MARRSANRPTEPTIESLRSAVTTKFPGCTPRIKGVGKEGLQMILRGDAKPGDAATYAAHKKVYVNPPTRRAAVSTTDVNAAKAAIINASKIAKEATPTMSEPTVTAKATDVPASSNGHAPTAPAGLTDKAAMLASLIGDLAKPALDVDAVDRIVSEKIAGAVASMAETVKAAIEAERSFAASLTVDDLKALIGTAKPDAPAAEAPAEATKTDDVLSGLYHPAVDPTFVLSAKLKALFSAQIATAKATGYAPNVLLTGPQGCGKTECAIQFAAATGLPLLKMNCALVREARDWFGAKMASGGRVYWQKAQFAEAIKRGNVVILLDEITRAVPSVLNALFGLLDATRQAFIEEAGETLHVGPNVFMFATANIGAQFTGAYGRIDSALNDRFAIRIPVSYLSLGDEASLLVKRTGISESDAIKMVKVATAIRKENKLGGRLTETLSTRSLLSAAHLFKTLGKDAFEWTILPLFSDEGGTDSEQSQVLQIIQAQFPATP